MNRIFSKCLITGLVLTFSALLFGCGSESGGEDPPPTLSWPAVSRSSGEVCASCHGTGEVADVDLKHSELDYRTQTVEGAYIASIDGVTIPNAAGAGGAPTITFTVRDENGTGITGLEDFRFAAAKLVAAAGGDASSWQSYVNRLATKAVGDPGSAADGSTAVQATYESAVAANLTDNGDGSYTYLCDVDLSAVTVAAGEVLDVAYEPALTHRFAIQIGGHGDPVANPVYDFQPSTGLRPAGGIATRNIATVASCNECHHKLAVHGGARTQVEYCVTCHNPGSADANSGNTIDMKVMIHKIHRGEDLPSVMAGGEYAIWGYQDSKHDYSEVVFPQDIRNCTKCHDAADAATPDGANWINNPTMEACGSCHDNISFTSPAPTGKVLHGGSVQPDNSLCAVCHSDIALASLYVANVHEMAQEVAAKAFKFTIVDIADTDKGESPVVTFSVTDPTSGTAYDILADPEFTAGSTSRLYVLIGWNTKEHTNIGSGQTPGLPVQINALTDATDNGDGTFSVTSPVAIPDDVSGSGVVAIEGHPAAVGDTPGTYDMRVPVKNAIQSFGITDVLAMDRRKVVDIAKCNQCHGNLSLHGNNRTGDIQVCVICHNGAATDINRRPDDPTTTADGKVEETIDFKHLIHAIHGAALREEGIVVYGYGNSEHDFSHVEYPGIINKCDACHINSTHTLPLAGAVWTTAIDTGDDLADPDDDMWMTQTVSVCYACHDGSDDVDHMLQKGGGFDNVRPAQVEEDINAGVVQPPGHSTAPSCLPPNACH